MFHVFGNETSLAAAGWHSGPDTRGTFNILSSCLITLFLCVWTSIHLNLPEYKKEHDQTFRRLGWLIIALLAPEVVAWNAWEQRRRVKWLTKKMQEQLYKTRQDRRIDQILGKQQNDCRCPYCKLSKLCKVLLRWVKRGGTMTTGIWREAKVKLMLEASDLDIDIERRDAVPDRKDDDNSSLWTDHHSWLTIMGGLVFDVSLAEARPILPDQREQLTLTDEGLILMSKHWPHLVPMLTRGEIEDKSKSDTLGKVITCWQATWFCIQCIFRLSSGSAISLLELNVFGHAICALLVCAIWWTKPKDIARPHILASSEYVSVAAILFNMSFEGEVDVRENDPYRFERVFQSSTPFRRPFKCRGLFWASKPMCNLEHAEFERYELYEYLPDCFPCVQPEQLAHRFPESSATAVFGMNDIASPGSLKIGDYHWTVRPKTHEYWGSMDKAHHHIHIDTITVNRLRAIRHHEQLHTISDELGRTHLGTDESDHRFLGYHYRHVFVCNRCRNWFVNDRAFRLTMQREGHETDGCARDVYIALSFAVATVASGLYGGLHALAWNALLPSATELLLWQASSATIAASGATALAACIYDPFVASYLLWSVVGLRGRWGLLLFCINDIVASALRWGQTLLAALAIP